MALQSVFIIQEDEDSNNELMSVLKNKNFKVLGSATTGEEGVERVFQLKPNLVITDLALPGIDGLEVIERISNIAPDVKVVVLSAIATDNIIKRAMLKGAIYFFVKPINNATLCTRLCDLLEDSERMQQKLFGFKQISLDEKISKIFISVGIPPHIKGYSYLREGVKMAVSQPAIINSITKQLYPKIGEKYETTPSKVERAIRHAIEVAWNRGRIDNINGLFGVRAYVGSEKPTNGEFIALVADKMLLEGA